MFLKLAIASAVVATTVLAAYYFNLRNIDINHLKYRNYRKAVNAEGSRKDDLAFYYAFMKNQRSAVWHYKRLFGVSSKCATQIVEEIELAYLVKNKNNTLTPTTDLKKKLNTLV